MYAGPEVDRKRGLSADIFSLGSVFVEMFGVLATSNRESHRDALIKVLQSNEDQPWRSYQGNINSVRIWLSELLDRNTFNAHFLELYPFSKEVHKMIDFDPAKRPSAAQLVSFFDQALCCTASVGPDYFVANETIQEDEGSVPPRTVQILAQQPYEQKFPLYHACASLQHRFSTNPKLRYLLAEDEKTIVVQRDGVDSVNLIWRLLRRGSPLLLLFDAPINPSLLVNKSWSSQRRLAKRAVALFLSVCIEELRIPPTECFTITDLFLDDILGFLKVRVLLFFDLPSY
jgi:serine/threonine protein kinase